MGGFYGEINVFELDLGIWYLLSEDSFFGEENGI